MLGAGHSAGVRTTNRRYQCRTLGRRWGDTLKLPCPRQSVREWWSSLPAAAALAFPLLVPLLPSPFGSAHLTLAHPNGQPSLHFPAWTWKAGLCSRCHSRMVTHNVVARRATGDARGAGDTRGTGYTRRGCCSAGCAQGKLSKQGCVIFFFGAWHNVEAAVPPTTLLSPWRSP